VGDCHVALTVEQGAGEVFMLRRRSGKLKKERLSKRFYEILRKITEKIKKPSNSSIVDQ
jgi:hypothetical protein